MIKDVERGKNDICEHLKNIRSNPEERAHELVELLEDKATLSNKFSNRKISKKYKTDKNEYDNFCKAYIIHLFNNFIPHDEDAEIMLLAFNYLPEYKREKRAIQRRALYAREKYEPRHPERKQGSSIDAKCRKLYEEESRIMDELSEVLAKLAVKQGGTLKLVEEVLATLKTSGAKEDSLLSGGNSATSPSKDDPATIGDQQGSRSKEEAQPDTSPPPSQPQPTNVHIEHGSHNTTNLIFNYNGLHINIRQHWWAILILVAVVAIIGRIVYFNFFHVPPVDEIFVSKEEIILAPGEKCPLKVAVIPEEARNAPLSFVSSDPDTVTASHTGVLTAYDSSRIKSRPYQKVDITIQAESGVTETKTVVVNFTGIGQPKINEEVEAGFYVWPQVRLVGSKDWFTTVEAKVGDKVEFWIQYRNISSENQENVMIRDVLPQSLRYVTGTTKLWNDHLNGAVNNENTIATTGINIGHYGPNANAHVRFQAEVIEDGLVSGSNALFNWAQISAADVFLQDYVSIIVNNS